MLWNSVIFLFKGVETEVQRVNDLPKSQSCGINTNLDLVNPAQGSFVIGYANRGAYLRKLPQDGSLQGCPAPTPGWPPQLNTEIL